MSAPGDPVRIGHLHPTHAAERDFREIFHAFGFELFEGPEIETEWWNFEALNIPPDHPARDLWDTLYVAEPGSDPPVPAADGTILRTHTSPVQIRAMKALTPPIRVITPGRCFRYENVAADRSFEFFQIEALVVDRDTSLAELKGMLEELARAMYGSETRTRFRPGYYPFTEPSVAFDISCQVCGGVGCPVCKRTGWVTILGAGMVHPTVIRNGGHDPDEYQGYAVGFGVLIAVAMVGLSVLAFGSYGTTLFVATPFVMGATAAFVYNAGATRSGLAASPAVLAAIGCGIACVTVASLAMAASLALPRLAIWLLVFGLVFITTVAASTAFWPAPADPTQIGGTRAFLVLLDRFGPPIAGAMLRALAAWLPGTPVPADFAAVFARGVVWAALGLASLAAAFRRIELR
jgi:phenylalanyl-tRNA synthetase alpha subunit